MYTNKIPKSQLPDKFPYTIYNFNTIKLSLEQSLQNWKEPYLRVISIDPGSKKFAICVEKRPRGPGLIQNELFINLSLSSAFNPRGFECDLYNNLTNFLDQHLTLFHCCHLIIIERQMAINYKMVRVSQHVLSYFSIKLKNSPFLPIIMEIDSKIKSSQLSAPKGMNRIHLKKWTVSIVRTLLSMRRDLKSLGILNSHTITEQYDLSDTVAQIEGLFTLLKLGLTKLPIKLNIISKK